MYRIHLLAFRISLYLILWSNVVFVVQSLSHVLLFVTSWTAACQAPCPPLSHSAFSDSCPLSQWCHPTVSSSVTPISSCPQSFPASQSFPMSQLFPSVDQSIGASASASVLPMNIQHWFPLGLTGLISLLSKGLSRVFSSTTIWKHQFFGPQASYGPTLTSIHDYWKNHSFYWMDFVGKVMSLLFNMLSTFVIAFLPRSMRP